MKFCFVASACKKYQPEIVALLNSLHAIGNKHDFFLIGYELPKELTDQFDKLCFKVIYYDIPEAEARQFGGESEILCRKRYWYAAEWGKQYDAVCLLDADMCFVRNVDHYFEIAAKCKLILGPNLEQKKVYGSHEHQNYGGLNRFPTPIWNEKDMSCTPMFIDAKEYEAHLKDSWNIFANGFPDTNFRAPDQEALNSLLLERGMNERKMYIPNLQFIGTNEGFLKPYQRVTTQNDGLLWTESGMPIFMIHGGFYHAVWRKQQILNRHGCAEGYLGYSFNSDNMAKGAMNCLYEFFKKCLLGPIQIDTKKAYRNNGHPDYTAEERSEVLI